MPRHCRLRVLQLVFTCSHSCSREPWWYGCWDVLSFGGGYIAWTYLLHHFNHVFPYPTLETGSASHFGELYGGTLAALVVAYILLRVVSNWWWKQALELQVLPARLSTLRLVQVVPSPAAGYGKAEVAMPPLPPPNYYNEPTRFY